MSVQLPGHLQDAIAEWARAEDVFVTVLSSARCEGRGGSAVYALNAQGATQEEVAAHLEAAAATLREQGTRVAYDACKEGLARTGTDDEHTTGG